MDKTHEECMKIIGESLKNSDNTAEEMILTLACAFYGLTAAISSEDEISEKIKKKVEEEIPCDLHIFCDAARFVKSIVERLYQSEQE